MRTIYLLIFLLIGTLVSESFADAGSGYPISNRNTDSKNIACKDITQDTVHNRPNCHINISQNNSNPPSSTKSIDTNKCNSDSCTKDAILTKDSISTLQAWMQVIGLFFTGLALVFGAIVGVNVYQGGTILKDARAELASVQEARSQLNSAKKEYEDGLTELKSRADKIMTDAIDKINLEAKGTLQEITKKAYRNSTLEKYITAIHEHLSSDQIDENAIYPLVTALFGYKDRDVLETYKACFNKLPPSSEVIREIIRHGFDDFA